jgi:hydroxymethylbilane synthase
MSMRLKLGTRKSALAMAQSGQMAKALEKAHPGLEVQLVPIVTLGDRLPGDLAAHGGKGLFTEELERGLQEGSLDLAVHSLKDLPVQPPTDLSIAAYPARADARDLLICQGAETLQALPKASVLLTGSQRRQAQILALRPDLIVQPLRGNIDTRLRKWRESGATAVILAAAGLQRLHIDGVPAFPIPTDVMLPAPGQGTLALQVRRGSRAEALCAALDDPDTRLTALAERRVVRGLGADCTLPLAAWAHRISDGFLCLEARLTTPDGRHEAKARVQGDDPEALGDACLRALNKAGAEDILRRLRQ